jgi:23S rRNA pseudouridine1911/1915/1917 synthase
MATKINLVETDETDDTEELFLKDEIKVDKGQEQLRIDKFLSVRMTANISRTRIQSGIDAGNITVNGKQVKSNYKIRPLDVITLLIPKALESYDYSPEDIPLDVLYEDNEVLVINKQAGLVCHQGTGNYKGTLINALAFHFQNEKIAGPAERPGLVHRLDKDTSGVMVIAKTENALAKLGKQFFDKTTQRKYIAMVWGNVEEDSGTVTGHIGRHSRDRRQYEVFEDASLGKHAVTHYKVIKRYNYVTLVECQLETGRTHQIRVHMKHIGHTLFNDERYGGDRILKGTVYSKYKQFIDNCFSVMPRQALHAALLGFVHPTTGKEMIFNKELPEDFSALIEKWERYWSAISETS